MTEKLNTVLEYHKRTKHHFHAYARGPGYLDWNNQPKAFRRYSGVEIFPLDKSFQRHSPPYEKSFWLGKIPSQPINASTIGQLYFDSLSISAWKSTGSDRWALRVNPSSGNLHPTEGYLICSAVEGLSNTPAVYHYAPDEHLLEERAIFPVDVWEALTYQLPENVILVGLTSIFWREAWKYGERAYRYCQHDIGHAIAAISIAAGGLGWQLRMLDDLSSRQIALLLGLPQNSDPESEHSEVILAVYPNETRQVNWKLPEEIIARFTDLEWRGIPNTLSTSYRDWSIIQEVSKAVDKPSGQVIRSDQHLSQRQFCLDKSRDFPEKPRLREIVRRRRSAVAMDGQTHIDLDSFYKILCSTLAMPDRIPFYFLPWSPKVHLVIFVHLVDGLETGLYLLVRDNNQLEDLRRAIKGDFSWEILRNKPDGLELFKLAEGDGRALARQISCHQDIAAYGCFSLGMIAHFEPSLREQGAWFYPYLYWECGMIGQILYLEAEATGLRGTGIGCFFDDAMHSILSIDSFEYQDLYHFTIGGSLEDMRLTTLPAYPNLK